MMLQLVVRRARQERLRRLVGVRSRRLGLQDKAGGYLCGGEGGVGSRRRRRTCQTWAGENVVLCCS